MTYRCALSAIALAFSSLSFVAIPSHAAAPIAKTVAPGFYHTMIGNFEVTALSDGTVSLPMDKLINNMKPADVDKQLSRHFLKSPVDTSINAFLVNTGGKLVLIDTGTGGSFGPTNGRLLANLKAAGYQPEQVDEIYLTHMHGDHLGGLSAEGKAVFPNAIVRAAQHEADYWLSAMNLKSAPEDKKDAFKTAMTALKPYIGAAHFKPFDGKAELVPGITALPAPGHTPGHTTYLIESKGEKLMLWGDLMHLAAVQFEHPEATIQFDTDNKAAAASRKAAYADAAHQGYMVGAAHLSYPGLGHLRAEGKGYVFEPVNYAPVH